MQGAPGNNPVDKYTAADELREEAAAMKDPEERQETLVVAEGVEAGTFKEARWDSPEAEEEARATATARARVQSTLQQ